MAEIKQAACRPVTSKRGTQLEEQGAVRPKSDYRGQLLDALVARDKLDEAIKIKLDKIAGQREASTWQLLVAKHMRCALTFLLQAEHPTSYELLKRLEELARHLMDRQHFLDKLELAIFSDSSDEDES